MSPFQYGIDFGAIGGLQAMSGFLEVPPHPHLPTSHPTPNSHKAQGLRPPRPHRARWLQHLAGPTTAHLLADDARRVPKFLDRRLLRGLPGAPPVSVARVAAVHRVERCDDDHDESGWVVCGAVIDRVGEWVVYDV
jgi:hypothetical protein